MGKKLTSSHAAKDLGVLDSNMTFIDHITYTASSCMAPFGKIKREEHCSDRQTLIFNSLGFRKLFYLPFV